MKKLTINIEGVPLSLEEIKAIKLERVELSSLCENLTTAIVVSFIASFLGFAYLWLSSFGLIGGWFYEFLSAFLPEQTGAVAVLAAFAALIVPPLLFILFWLTVATIKDVKCKRLPEISKNKSDLVEVSPQSNPEEMKQIVEWANEFPAIKKYVQSIEGRYPIKLEYEEFERYVKLEKSKLNKERLVEQAEVDYKELVNS